MHRLLPFVLSQLSASAPTVRTDYVGNLVYRDGLLGRILVDGGAIAAKDSTLAAAYEFAYADHLGSVRALVQMGDSLYRKTEYGPYGKVLAERRTSQLVSSDFGLGEVIEVEEEDDAEPGGGPRSISLIQTRLDNPYRFGGKERLDAGALNLYDFGARYFTPALPRWLTMDPLSEKYYGVSPYVYCAGNPINAIDVNGRFPLATNLLGAVVGAGAEYTSQVISNIIVSGFSKEAFTNVDLADVAVAAVEGFVTSGTSVLKKQGVKVAVSLGSSILKNSIDFQVNSQSEEDHFRINDAESIVTTTLIDYCATPLKMIGRGGSKVAKQTTKSQAIKQARAQAQVKGRAFRKEEAKKVAKETETKNKVSREVKQVVENELSNYWINTGENTIKKWIFDE